ncbi:MAG: helix-turn-helix domain-containing protein [Chitinophagaceae bacterium]
MTANTMINLAALEKDNNLLLLTSAHNYNLNSDVGVGTVKVFDLEKGLQIWMWDCTFHAEMELSYALNNKKDKAFTLSYYLTNEGLSFWYDGNSLPKSSVWNAVFFSNDANFKTHIPPNVPVRCLTINFTPAWLNENVLRTYDTEIFLSKDFKIEKPFVLIESIFSSEQDIISDLFENLISNPLGSIFIRSGVLNIASDFFSKIKQRRNLNLFNSYAYRGNAIAEIEKLLTQSLCGTLPNLKDLSRKFSMSESTLKRHFKKIYGTNIYTYFLEKKMAYARQLIQEKKVNVTDTAYILGYQKVSHFIAMFKKHYGFLPGSLKERKAV